MQIISILTRMQITFQMDKQYVLGMLIVCLGRQFDSFVTFLDIHKVHNILKNC